MASLGRVREAAGWTQTSVISCPSQKEKSALIEMGLRMFFSIIARTKGCCNEWDVYVETISMPYPTLSS